LKLTELASIGVGLFGKEGTQAARSADYAIREFRHLKRLLIVHGRYSLVRNSSLIHYSLYKNAAFALGQFWFAYWCAWSGQRLYNDYMMLFFNMLFTAIPTIFIAMFEKDIKEDLIVDHPELYRELRTGYLFNYKTAMLWLITALYHSCGNNDISQFNFNFASFVLCFIHDLPKRRYFPKWPSCGTLGSRLSDTDFCCRNGSLKTRHRNSLLGPSYSHRHLGKYRYLFRRFSCHFLS
jgi:hypothetical protein